MLKSLMRLRRGDFPWEYHCALLQVTSLEGRLIGGNIMRRKVGGKTQYREQCIEEAEGHDDLFVW